ncbi:MAG: L,D-transpeptidase family protein [Luteolibacter sp.]
MIRRVAFCLTPLLLASCAWKKPLPPEPPKPSFHVDQARYDALRPKDTRVRIDLTEQKAQVLDRHDAVVLETDVSTGKPGHETPAGSFRITEKIADKRSNRYGRYKDPKSGADLGASADLPKPPKDAVYEGYSMPYWMRLTWDGVGIHVGYVVPRSALSYGCIRVPQAVQPLIFEKCRVGTPVEITGDAGGGLKPAHPAR